MAYAIRSGAAVVGACSSPYRTKATAMLNESESWGHAIGAVPSSVCDETAERFLSLSAIICARALLSCDAIVTPEDVEGTR